MSNKILSCHDNDNMVEIINTIKEVSIQVPIALPTIVNQTWETITFSTPPNSFFQAEINKNYVISSNSIPNFNGPFICRIVDPVSANPGDFYLIYKQNIFTSISINYEPGLAGLFFVRVNESYTSTPNWKTYTIYNPASIVKAWINFNGTGTVSIRSSFGISSIIDNNIGDYTINFTTPFANTNYTFVTWARDYNNDNTIINNFGARSATTKTTSSIRLLNSNDNNATLYDSPECNIIFFGV